MEDIICPKCHNIIEPKNRWNFMDGEERKISCACGKQFIVIIERPIEYYVVES